MSEEKSKSEIPYPLNFVSPRGVKWTMHCPVGHFRRTADLCDRVLTMESLMGMVLDKLGCTFAELPVDKEELHDVTRKAVELGMKLRSEYDEKKVVLPSTPEITTALKKETILEKAKLGGNWYPNPDRFSDDSSSHHVSPRKLEFSDVAASGEDKGQGSRKRSAKSMLPATYSTVEKRDGSFLHEMKTDEKKPRSMLRVYSRNRNSLIKKTEVEKDNENKQ